MRNAAVMSFKSAQRPFSSRRSSQCATVSGSLSFGVVCKPSTTSLMLSSALARAASAGQISATVSASRPTKS